MIVTLQELLAILNERKGAVMLVVETSTTPKMLKKSRTTGDPNPWENGVLRVAIGRFVLNNNYGNNVEAAREKDGHPAPEDFQPAGLWVSEDFPEGAGYRIGKWLVGHRGKPGQLYFRTRPLRNPQTGQLDKLRDRYSTNDDRDYEFEGDELEALKRDYLPKPSNSRKQELPEDKQIPYRPYKIEGIVAVHLNGQRYIIDHEAGYPQFNPPQFA